MKSPGVKGIFPSAIAGCLLLFLASSLSVLPSLAQGVPSPQYPAFPSETPGHVRRRPTASTTSGAT